MVTDYADETTIDPRLYFSILFPRLHTMVIHVVQRYFQGFIVHFVCMAMHGCTQWWWENNSPEAVIVHFVPMVAEMWWLDNNSSNATVVHFERLVTHYAVETMIVPRLYCPFCVHGYIPWWWDNNSSKAVIVHFVCIVVHYLDGATIILRLYLSILCARLHTMLMGHKVPML